MIIISAFLLLASGNSEVFGAIRCSRTPVSGMFPGELLVGDGTSAGEIAEVVLSRVYGKEKIYRQKPFRIVDQGDKYIVTGSLPKGRVGGVAMLAICKIDGQVASIRHSK